MDKIEEIFYKKFNISDDWHYISQELLKGLIQICEKQESGFFTKNVRLHLRKNTLEKLISLADNKNVYKQVREVFYQDK